MSTHTIRGEIQDMPASLLPRYTSEAARPIPKPTGPQVAHFILNSATYMVSTSGDHDSALNVTLQGRTIAIPVACLVIQRGAIISAQWEAPYSGYLPEWQRKLIELVSESASHLIEEVAG